jgi:hypothetical protein
MRKLILLVLSSAMLLGGLYLVLELWFAGIIYFRFVVGGVLLVFAGGYLIWTDFIAPRLGVKTWEDP